MVCMLINKSKSKRLHCVSGLTDYYLPLDDFIKEITRQFYDDRNMLLQRIIRLQLLIELLHISCLKPPVPVSRYTRISCEHISEM